MTLPDNPSLENLRNRARALHRAARAGDAEALARIRRHAGDVADVRLSTAQLVVAREAGFASWPKLKHHLDVVEEYRWRDGVGSGSPGDEFCRLACLNYTNDDPQLRDDAQRLLIARPELVQDHIWAAAAAADLDAVRDLQANDPALVRRRGGPNNWEPLAYLLYSRVVAGDPLGAASLLLSTGADANTGYLWHGMATPFTLLTGAFGEGEQGPVRQPRHHRSLELAELLLTAGADPNDGQALYNRMFQDDDTHLRLLFRFGLGRGDGGPWRARLGDAVQSPSQLVRGQLKWAVTHGQRARVQLLLANDVDCLTPYPDQRTACGIALVNGHNEIVDDLVAAGAPRPVLHGVDAFVAALFAGSAVSDDLVAEARRRRPGLIVWATACHRADVVEKLVELGFDVNAYGRGDVPVEQPWQTALHQAAGDGDLAMAELLLRLGADRSLRDARFDATPSGWASHFDHDAMAELLAP